MLIISKVVVFMSEKKKEISIKLENLTSEIDDESYLNFSCEAIFENLFENEFICEFQLSFYNSDGNKKESKWDHIYYGPIERSIVNSSNNSIYSAATINIDGAYIPNEIKFFYRLSKEIGSINFTPKLPQKRNTSIVNVPPKGLLGGNKWGTKAVEINSLIVKNGEDGFFEYKFTAGSSRPGERGIIFEFSTADNKTEGDPIIFNDTFITQSANIEASEKADINCRIFEPLKWTALTNSSSFITEKVSNE